VATAARLLSSVRRDIYEIRDQRADCVYRLVGPDLRNDRLSAEVTRSDSTVTVVTIAPSTSTWTGKSGHELHAMNALVGWLSDDMKTITDSDRAVVGRVARHGARLSSHACSIELLGDDERFMTVAILAARCQLGRGF
jgi:hypothetical protein